MRFETNVADRKLLARKLAEFTGERIHYLGPPSFAYSVGGYLIARDGAVSTESEEGSEALHVFLEENNLLKPEVTELVIRLPLLDMDADALKRLVYMVRSKQYLLNKAIGADSFAVSEELVVALETTVILDRTAFLDVFSQHDCRGLAFDMERQLGIPTNYYMRTCMEGYYNFGFDYEYLLKAYEFSKEGIEG